MKRIAAGALIGLIAGVIDVVPMVARGLPWSANGSAFLMWIVVGIIVAVSDFGLPAAVHGIVVGFLVLAPSAILIGAVEPLSLLPISVMTLLLGSGVGVAARRLIKA